MADAPQDSASARRAKRAMRNTAEERAKKAPYVPNPAYHARGVKGAKATNDKRAADKARDGNNAKVRPFNSHEHAFSKIGTLLALLAAAVTMSLAPKTRTPTSGLFARFPKAFFLRFDEPILGSICTCAFLAEIDTSWTSAGPHFFLVRSL